MLSAHLEQIVVVILVFDVLGVVIALAGDYVKLGEVAVESREEEDASAGHVPDGEGGQTREVDGGDGEWVEVKVISRSVNEDIWASAREKSAKPPSVWYGSR